MLIPPRRVGESLKIGNDIRVTVLGVRGNQIRMGIYAPADVPVHREEIYDRIHEEVDPEIDGPGSGSNPDTAQ